MKVSIIVPVYNVEPYIEGCLKSVGMQQYDGEIECIVVDDCGTDKSIDIARRYIEDYNGTVKFNIISHECNRGLSAARNTGLSNSSGEFAFFLDSDDEIYPETISLMVNILNDNPYSDIVIGQFYCPTYPTRYFFPYCSNNICIRGDGCGQYLFFSNCNYIPSNATNKLIRMSLAKKFLFKEGIIHEDELWMYQICQEVTCISFAHSPTYIRVINSNSIIETSTINRSGHNWSIIFKYVIANPPTRFKDLAILRYLTVFLQFYPNITEDTITYRELYKDFIMNLNSPRFKRIRFLLKYGILFPKRFSKWYYRLVLRYIRCVRNSMVAGYNTH